MNAGFLPFFMFNYFFVFIDFVMSMAISSFFFDFSDFFFSFFFFKLVYSYLPMNAFFLPFFIYNYFLFFIDHDRPMASSSILFDFSDFFFPIFFRMVSVWLKLD